ncbi:MAG TPA: hypothetical protein DIC42_05055 [Holosporales bacterium]|nr:hypothetical protein [Holosporales bacterium]
MFKKLAVHISKIYPLFYICIGLAFISPINNLQAADELSDIIIRESKKQEGLYYIQCKKTGLYVVLEKITKKNINDWINFAKRQESIYGRALNKYAAKKRLPSLNGISPFKNRLLNYDVTQLSKCKNDYDMYASYLMNTNPEQADNTQKFGTITSVENSAIAMITTVQISKNHAFYSALGISRTVDEAVRISKNGSNPTNSNSMPMHIYTYTYYILKQHYPNIEAMVSTPVLAVRKIFQKFIPKDFITVGPSLEETFSTLPWVKQDPCSFAYRMSPEPDFFKGAIITKINGQAFLNYLKSSFNLN